jgi:anhydro-N-acetylmuramic acid kinase
MANITILPAHSDVTRVTAFDTGPGNVWIDAAAKATFGMSYDSNGATARAGMVIKTFLDEMMNIPYFEANPPKSTGRETFSEAELRRLVTRYAHPSAPLEDVLTTVTELTAWSIADHVRRYAPGTREIIASGGGVKNSYLMDRITQRCLELELELELRIHPHADAKEAMAFAYLGWLTLEGLPGNIPSVTGASRSVVLGSIARA